LGEIEKIRALHNLRNVFQVPSDVVEQLERQVNDPALKKQLSRFYAGYDAEESYHLLVSALPWVKLAHALEERQLPSGSKAQYQVPDYLVLYETSKRAICPVLVDVKSVKESKVTLTIMRRQAEALAAYASAVNIPLLFAIYWRRVLLWTLNTLDQFTAKRQEYGLSLFTAIQDDLSVMLGDVSFLISPFRLTSRLNQSANSSERDVRHEEFGYVVRTELEINKRILGLSSAEMALVDSLTKLRREAVERDGAFVTLTECSDELLVPNLTSILMRLLATFNVKLSEKDLGAARGVVLNSLYRFGVDRTLMMPARRTATADALFRQAFEGSWLLEQYEART
jgi:hypothetical protein